MKTIAIFCDGTWQYLTQAYPTNVALLSACVAKTDENGQAQTVYYDDGVGVVQGAAGTPTTSVLGGAFGEGLDTKVLDAYNFLCQNYDPGDRIFIFGFSRGAFTARSLGGMLRWAWIPKRENAAQTSQAMTLYRGRPAKDAAPAAEQAFQDRMNAFRAAYCWTTSVFTDVQSYDPEDAATLTPPDPSNNAWVQYIGVWDTVGELGIPANLPLASVVDAQYQFYDTSLSRFVRSARHAVSIDERRDTFSPTLWDNIADLNAHSNASMLAYDVMPYQQTWFPGGHGSVGGGSQDGGLSLPPMLWIAEGAARAGLAFDEAKLQAYAAAAHPEAAFQPDGFSLGGLLEEAAGMADRVGPTAFDEVSLSARLRHKKLSYNPPPLQRAQVVAAGLTTFQPPVDPQTYYNP